MSPRRLSHLPLGTTALALGLSLLGGAGCASEPPAEPSPVAPASGGEVAPGPTEGAPELVERRPGRTYEEERARRIAVQEVEARAVLARLPSVRLGMPFDEALLLLGIDQAHLLVRARGARRIAEYARASYVLELTYAPARGPGLLSAVMYELRAGGARVEVGRARPSVQPVAPAADAVFATAAEVRFSWTVVGEVPVTVRVCADAACTAEVASIPGLSAERSGQVGLAAEVPSGVYYWSTVAQGVATEPRRLFVGAVGPDFEPFASSSRHSVGEPLGREGRVRLVPRGPFWTARLHRAADDSSTVLLVLRLGEDSRFLALEGTDPDSVRIRPVYRPDHGQSLLLAETRPSGDVRTRLVHLIEDEGQGPRRVFRASIHRCAPAEGCDPRTRVRERIGYRDTDGDGVLDLLQLTAVVGEEEIVTRISRDPAGRYALPSEVPTASAP